ncbi:MAG: ribosome maturation factor RimM [Eubacteriales bacterium]|nr:ribosome maturation factor RimM [Eubacteriales bacterium]
MEKIKIGKIVNTVGLKGEVKVYKYSDSIEIYETIESIYVEDRLTVIENVRAQKNMVILKLEGADDRNAAEALRGKELYITEDDLPELPEGQYYVRDLIGMSVTEEDGNLLGHVTDVLQNTAQDIFEVESENGKKLLIPKVDQFVLDIDAEKREITVRLIEGMLDL